MAWKHGADAADFGKRERAKRLDRAHRTNAYRRPQPARHLSLSDRGVCRTVAADGNPEDRQTGLLMMSAMAKTSPFALANGKY